MRMRGKAKRCVWKNREGGGTMCGRYMLLAGPSSCPGSALQVLGSGRSYCPIYDICIHTKDSGGRDVIAHTLPHL